MAKVFPLKAFHYNPAKVGPLSDVIIPPYDNIPAGEEKKYFARSLYNFAHVLLPHEGDPDYDRAAVLLPKWLELGILTQDTSPGYYIYRQSFLLYGQMHVRHTLMATVELHDFKDGIVRPHENTFGKYKEDRLRILRKTQCNLSHIFGMVRDPEGFLNSLYEKWEFKTPLLDAKTDDGVEHSIWKVSPNDAPALPKFFDERPIYIVDGHHRYESSLTYAKELGVVGNAAHPASRMLFAIANSYDPALVVLPTHRKGLTGSVNWAEVAKHFDLVPMDSENLLKDFTRHPRQAPEFVVYAQDKLQRAIPKHWEQTGDLGQARGRLAVAWSDEKFLPLVGITGDRSTAIQYEKDAAALWENRHASPWIIFHAPPAVTDVLDVADANEFMPQKSTFFYPKLAAGLVMRNHRADV